MAMVSVALPPNFLSPLKTLTLIPNRLFHRFSFRRVLFSPSIAITSSLSLQEQKGVESKKQWRAAIDFKWIRENKDIVAANIKNRKSDADLELVLELHEKFLSL